MEKSWSGALKGIVLPEVLARLHRDRTSGTLTCKRGSQVVRIRVAAGTPTWAWSEEPDDFVGYALFQRGLLDLDSALAHSDAVTAAAASAAGLQVSREHAVDLLCDVFSWRDGIFRFAPDGSGDGQAQAFELSFAALLCRGLRHVRSAGVVCRAVVALGEHIEAIGEPPEEVARALDTLAHRVLEAVRGQGTLGSRETPPPADYLVLQSLWKLALLDLVRATSGKGVPVRSLLASGAGSGVADDTPTRVVASVPRPPVAADGGHVRVTSIDPSELSGPVTPIDNEAMALEWARNGNRFLKKSDLFHAITSYREAVRLMPDSFEYRWQLGSLLARAPKWRKEAEEHLLRAEQIKAWDLGVQLTLGKLYQKAGLNRRAQARYRTILEMDPSHEVALDGLKVCSDSAKSDPGILSRLSGRPASGAPAEALSEEEDQMVLEV